MRGFLLLIVAHLHEFFVLQADWVNVSIGDSRLYIFVDYNLVEPLHPGLVYN
jgi:hypothetical protein